MKTIRNKTSRPLRVKLRGGKTLHLAPLKTGHIADGAEDAPGVRAMIEAGEIEIVGEGPGHHDGSGGQAAPGTQTHGHHPPLGIPPKGDR